MRIDLHTHSSVSDGTQSPTELVRAAHASGLDVLGLTDHDTTASWDEGAAAAAEAGITLVRGLEISTRYAGQGVHLLGYLPDPTHPPLIEALDKILDGRNSRVPAILRRLQDLGIDIDVEALRRVAGDAAAIGRPHIADALISLDVVESREEAFARFLAPGKPAYVDRYAAPLEEMIAIVSESGGVSVLAHPWGRHGHAVLDEAGLAHLRDLGLAGIEVDHNDHDAATREELRAIAKDLDLVVTGSSDHHGTGKADAPLGCNLTAPAEYAELLARAAHASAASGRTTPGVLPA